MIKKKREEMKATFEENIGNKLTEGSMQIREIYKLVTKEIKESGEIEFLKSFNNKYLVILRGDKSFFYGKIKSASGNFSFRDMTLNYTVKIAYIKDAKESTVYVSPATRNYKLFDIKEDAINYTKNK